MNQEPIGELLSRSLDEELSNDEQERLQQALAHSGTLRQLQLDLKLLVELAASETPIAPPLSESLVARVTHARQARRQPLIWVPVLLAAATLMLFLASFWKQEQRDFLNENAVSVRQLEHQSSRRYYLAIQGLEGLATYQLTLMPPQMALNYANHLHLINRSLHRSESAMERSNGNAHSHRELAELYIAKLDLLERILSG